MAHKPEFLREANQALVQCYFLSFVYSTITKQVESIGQYNHQCYWITEALKKPNHLSINEDGLLGKVWIGNTNQHICVPGNSALIIPDRLGKNTKIPSGTHCMVDMAGVYNLL